MSSFSEPQQTLDILQNDTSEIIAVASVMLGVAFSSVVLRFISKSLDVKKFGLDDLFISFALLCFLAMESLILEAVDAGRNAKTKDDEGYSKFVQFTYIACIIYRSVIAFSITSILFLYRRIFSPHRSFSIALYTLIGLTFTLWISGTICETVGLLPLRALWNPRVQGQSHINYKAFWLTSMIVELALEIATLAVPVREIAKLRLENHKRVLITVMFCFGTFVIAAGMIRIAYIWMQNNTTSGVNWLSIHSAIIVVSACLPTYGPLLSHIPCLKVGGSSGQTTYTSDKYTGGRAPNRAISRSPRKLRIDPKLARNSLDGILLGGPALEGIGSFDLHDHEFSYHEKHTSIETTCGLEHGLTKQLSIPSPTSTDGDWTASAFLGMEGSLQKWPQRLPGPRTKRAELEYKKQKKSKPKEEKI